jgi:hypothetical protein
MTWWRDGDHYEVFFNRDELKTRAAATPPKLLESANGVGYLAPNDPVAGGTWMLANEHRVTVCLLNRWHESALYNGPFESRGLLVNTLADCTSAHEAMLRLQKMRQIHYRPFTLVALDPHEILAASWNGETLTEEFLSPPLTSSSYCFPEVAAARQRAFHRMSDIAPDQLRKYQQGESPATAYTVRMNRPDAQTWSRSHVCVSPERISWEYIEESPDLTDDGTVHRTELPLH